MPLDNLPLELRQEIWRFSLPTDDDDIPEVCIAWPLYAGGARKIEPEENFFLGGLPTRPFIVDVGFPVAMHVCRESRAFVTSKLSGVRFRESPAAECMVPFRHFRPELDIMYFSFWNGGQIIDQGGPRVSGHWWADLRHLALDANRAHAVSLPEFILHYLPKLETLSVVLPDSSNNNTVLVQSKPPTRRCRLRPIPRDTAQNMTLVMNYWGQKQPRSLSDLTNEIHRVLDEEGKRHFDWVQGFKPLKLPYSGGFNPTTGSFENIHVSVLTFVEYHGTGKWVEVCSDRKYRDKWQDMDFFSQSEIAEDPSRYIPIANRRNPEEYRVNDDDGALLEQAGIF